MSLLSSLRTRIPLTLILLAVACSSASTGSTDNGTPAISLTLSSTVIGVLPTGSTAVSATLKRTAFTGAVTVSVEGLPVGVTGVAVLNGNTATVTITTTSAVTGTYQLTVRAKGTGVSDATASLTVAVGNAVAGAFALSMSPSDLTLSGIGSVTSHILITRSGGFAGDISFSVPGVVAYLSGSVSPNPTSLSSSTLTLTSTAAIPPGTYTITVNGTASGLTSQSATLTLVVQ